MTRQRMEIDFTNLSETAKEEIQDMVAGYTPDFSIKEIPDQRHVCFREQDWKYLTDRINWAQLFLDARAQFFLDAQAVTIMNEPRKVRLPDDPDN